MYDTKKQLVEDINQHKFKRDGQDQLAVVIWGRDCDHCEGTKMEIIPATVEAYMKLFDKTEFYADGPFSLGILSKEDAAVFKPMFRDHILEALET